MTVLHLPVMLLMSGLMHKNSCKRYEIEEKHVTDMMVVIACLLDLTLSM